jgi:hypothetical protein
MADRAFEAGCWRSAQHAARQRTVESAGVMRDFQSARRFGQPILDERLVALLASNITTSRDQRIVRHVIRQLVDA